MGTVFRMDETKQWRFDQTIPEIEDKDGLITPHGVAQAIYEYLSRHIGKRLSFLISYNPEDPTSGWKSARYMMLDAEYLLTDRYSVENIRRMLLHDGIITIEIPCGTMPIHVSALLYTK